MDRMNAHECLSIYNKLTSRFFDGSKIFPRRVSKNSLAECEAFLTFCRSNKISPERFILAKHDCTKWRFRVPIKMLVRSSADFIKQFKEWGNDEQAYQQLNSRLANVVVADVDRSLELTILGEKAKTVFASDKLSCFVSEDITGGWNPRSKLCVSCSLRETCRDRLSDQVRESRNAWSR